MLNKLIKIVGDFGVKCKVLHSTARFSSVIPTDKGKFKARLESIEYRFIPWMWLKKKWKERNSFTATMVLEGNDPWKSNHHKVPVSSKPKPRPPRPQPPKRP